MDKESRSLLQVDQGQRPEGSPTAKSLPATEVAQILEGLTVGSSATSEALHDVMKRAREVILRLDKENRDLQGSVFHLSKDRTCRAPEMLLPFFDAAQRTVHEYFKSFCADPSEARIEIAGERYLLIRASALSVDFFHTIQKLYADRGDTEAFFIGQRFLFDIAKSIGMSDARAFHRKMGLSDPMAKLGAGPPHFAYTGWAYVDVKPESKPSTDETCFICYSHPYSFEADAWLRAGMKAQQPVCIMNAGYSSGWSEESLGVNLTAVEVSCRARGDETCTFILAPPQRVQDRLAEYARTRPLDLGPTHALRVPKFFESKLLEEEIRTKETRYRELFANMSDGVAVFEAIENGREFVFKDINDAALRIEHLRREEVIGHRLSELFPGAERFGLTEVLRRVHTTGWSEALPATFYEDIRRSGWRENFVYRLPTSEIVTVYRDVSAQKSFEQELRASESRLTAILEHMPVGVAMVDENRRITWLNDALRKMVGATTKEEITQQNCASVIGEWHPDANGMMADIEQEKKLVRRDCKELYVLHSVQPIKVGGTQQSLHVLIDISRRKALEAELQQARKLEAVGQLAAGIAHEINTPAQFVGDSVGFLSNAFGDVLGLVEEYRKLVAEIATNPAYARRLEEVSAAEEHADLEYVKQNAAGSVERARDGVMRIAGIVSAMKEFAHPDQRQKSPADLNRGLRSTLAIARSEYKYVADVETDFGEIPLVMGHIGDLNQVFLNLLVNAAHAIADVVKGTDARGKIDVRTRQEGSHVRIEIADTGCGIPEAIRDRIYDPFFTTKEVGRGSGQGLAIARSTIVDKHGGSLSFVSDVGKGTTFAILVPIDGTRDGESDGG